VARILVVDDEPSLVEAIRYNLRRDGHEVVTAGDGLVAVQLVRHTSPDLIVLDLMLPSIDGLEVCRIVRRDSQVPILMLTARDDEVDKIVGLELGADDYVTKPFSMRELMVRIKAMLRRSQLALAAPEHSGQIRLGEITIDPGQRRVTRDQLTLTMKPREFDLLHFLARHPNQVFTRDHLLDKVWGYQNVVDTRTVDVHVRWLREKIEVNPSAPTRLETVRGVGYRLVG
jgi:DNA-binding response OmpR family regulator